MHDFVFDHANVPIDVELYYQRTLELNWLNNQTSVNDNYHYFYVLALY